MIHKKAFRETTLFLSGIFLLLSLICVIFKLEDYPLFTLGFGGYIGTIFYAVYYKIFDFIEISIITLILCVLGLLLNNVLQIEEFVYAGIIIADIAFFKTYTQWTKHVIKIESEMAIEYFKHNPDAEIYENEDGSVSLNPTRFGKCKSLDEVNALIKHEAETRRK